MPPSEYAQWDENFLSKEWNKMFDYSFYKNHYESVEVQRTMLLVEGASTYVKTLVTSYAALQKSEKELLVRLESKNEECMSLKQQLDRSSKACTNCPTLEKALNDAKLESKDYRDQVDGIAKILNARFLAEPNAPQKSAFDLVSQIIAGSSPSPKRKKNRLEQESLGAAHAELPVAQVQDNANEKSVPAPSGVTRRTRSALSSPNLSHVKILPSTKSPTLGISIVRTRTNLSRSSDSDSSSKIIHAKKDLIGDLDDGDGKTVDKSVKKPEASFKSKLPPLKESPRRLAKTMEIWSSEDSDDEIMTSSKKAASCISESPPLVVDEKQKENSFGGIVLETPLLNKTDRKFWSLKERGSVQKESRSGRKFRQTKLKLGQKKSHSKVDLAEMVKLAGNNRIQSIAENDCVIPPSPETESFKRSPDGFLAAKELDITDFSPIASSTQMTKGPQPVAGTSGVSKATIPSTNRGLPGKVSSKKEHVYITAPVRKKEDKKKLDGWECKDCAQYYSAVGKEMDPAELKKRMNACSKHRKKFKPRLDETPPEFWNLLAPETEEFKGYSSVYEYQK
ncbi:Retinoblastoma Hypothetical protein protein 8 [Nesidiocoris tenuis]|uniref:DNA endonuclease activator Ctp1 C-terminal domain-containing protein n=1 Tax=Nesidiocoris tenuis TaxID=355587 RepID=A0ABN7BHH8_9HEMI|nr:Retinoblastoma Hypothetical protein protein 8 [Nesidiocoris tenuis]